MDSFIELDGHAYAFTTATLCWEGSDWLLTLHRDGAPPLELAGEADGNRLRIDLRSLDEVLGALQGRPITAYPGGQSVCAAFLDVLAAEGGGSVLSTAFELDWDRALDPPNTTHVEPRRARIHIIMMGPEGSLQPAHRE